MTTTIPPTGSVTRRTTSGPLRYALGTFHRCIAEAPVGEHAVLEAALAWQRLRPGGVGPAANIAARHLPIVETSSDAVAARVARLLSGLTWAIITRAEADEPSRTTSPAVRVAVPKVDYHRVLRALAGAWRQAVRQFGPGSQSGAADAGSAIALWRMGLLIFGPGPRPDMIYMRTGTATEAQMLTTAARLLGLTPAVERLPSGAAVVLHDMHDVRLLLTEAGAADAARLWAPGARAAAVRR